MEIPKDSYFQSTFNVRFPLGLHQIKSFWYKERNIAERMRLISKTVNIMNDIAKFGTLFLLYLTEMTLLK